jgi:hypothetical protein
MPMQFLGQVDTSKRKQDAGGDELGSFALSVTGMALQQERLQNEKTLLAAELEKIASAERMKALEEQNARLDQVERFSKIKALAGEFDKQEGSSKEKTSKYKKGSVQKGIDEGIQNQESLEESMLKAQALVTRMNIDKQLQETKLQREQVMALNEQRTANAEFLKSRASGKVSSGGKIQSLKPEERMALNEESTKAAEDIRYAVDKGTDLKLTLRKLKTRWDAKALPGHLFVPKMQSLFDELGKEVDVKSLLEGEATSSSSSRLPVRPGYHRVKVLQNGKEVEYDVPDKK